MARPLLLVWSMARACLHQAKQTGQEQRTLLHDNEGFPEGARTSMTNERIEEGLCELQKFGNRPEVVKSSRRGDARSHEAVVVLDEVDDEGFVPVELSGEAKGAPRQPRDASA